MISRTLSIKAYLFCYAFLFIFTACGAPDFSSPHDQESKNADTESDNDLTDPDASSISPDTQNFIDTRADIKPPKVTIKSVPETFTSETSATIDFECDQNDCTFECSMNSPFSDCAPPMRYENLSDTQHTFIVRAHNSAGATSPDKTHVWTVDTAAPEVIHLTAPPAYTNLKDAEIAFECNEADCTFHCALNENDFEPCASPISFEDLPDGKHSISVRATDLAANSGESVIAIWTVDTLKPEVIILSSPQSSTHFSSATFTFECNEPGCKFECSIDNQATFHNCTSPQNYEGFERQPQVFTLRATDRAGNVGLSTPHNWTVTWPKWTHVSVGTEHACGIIDDGTLWCWGKGVISNIIGQSSVKESEVPLQVESASDWQYISSNSLYNCGIRKGVVFCFGFLVDGTPEPNSLLRRINGTNWQTIQPGSYGHYCGIRNNNQIWCWGKNTYGQLGLGHTSTQKEPVRLTGNNWRSVTTGRSHTCAVNTSNHLYCWGSNSQGQLASTPSTTQLLIPTQITNLDTFDSVGAGEDHTLIATFDEPIGAGTNGYGQLGLGHFNENAYRNALPYTLRGLYRFTGGQDFSCGIQDDKVLCSGRNDYGQLGRGRISARESTFLTIQAPNIEFIRVDAGGHHACALDTNQNIWCWGGSAANSTPTQLPWPY